jgi:uncharacterized protein (UPF0276 family)
MFEWAIGLRPQHFRDWIDHTSRPLFEILTDNYIYQKSGPALEFLDVLSQERSPLMHGIGLNIGGLEPLDLEYLRRLKDLQKRIGSPLISDHLSFCRGSSLETYDLLPLPYTPDELERISSRVQKVQDYLGQAIALENISAYIRFECSSMTEMEFLRELCFRTGCQILLDVNNLYVSCSNLSWDLEREFSYIDVTSVQAIHVSGHSMRGRCLYDSHDENVSDPVLALLQRVVDLGVQVPVVLERDEPDLNHASLLREWERIQGLVSPPRCSLVTSKKSYRVLCHTEKVKNTEKEGRLQDDFLSQIRADLDLGPPPAVSLALHPLSSENWSVYVNGIIGRWTSLVDATLKRAVHIWGKPAITEVLLSFALTFPPRNPDMGQAFRSLPDFARSHEDYGAVIGLADMLELCFLFWEVLENPKAVAPASSTDLTALEVTLRQPAAFHRPWQVGLNIHELWLSSALVEPGIDLEKWEQLASRESAVLFVKSDENYLHALPIPPAVYPLVQELVNGQSLAHAIEVLADSPGGFPETVQESAIVELLNVLIGKNLLTEPTNPNDDFTSNHSAQRSMSV